MKWIYHFWKSSPYNNFLFIFNDTLDHSKKSKISVTSLTPVALVSSICFPLHLPPCLAVHPPALFSRYSGSEPSVWGHLFKAFSSPRILKPSPTCTQKNTSTTNPANMQSPLAKQRSPQFRLVSPRVPLSSILLSVYLPCTCTMQLRAHTRTFKERTDLTAWRQSLWHFGKQPWLPQPVDGLCNHIFPLREPVSKDAN